MIEPVAPRTERFVWGVAALVHALADTLAARYSGLALRGEISGFSQAGSGHCYLSLKDADGGNALIRCAMFRRTVALLDFAPDDGQLVEVRGRVAVYEPRGDLQFVIESMQRAGAGALYEQFLRLRNRLAQEGLFDAARKRPLPAYPRRIGVITSLGAAALHDVLTALTRRAPHVRVVLYPSLVQGSEAPAALASALSLAGQRKEVDLLILCRGGGSLEDLWAFNDERVVRALVDCALPVVCGVGHETDITLADLAADLRAPTPTAAAELASATQRECLDALADLASAMRRRVQQRLDAHAQALDRAAMRLRQPADGVRRRAQRLLISEHRLASSTRQVLQRHAHRQDALAARLQRALAVTLAARAQRLAAWTARLQASDPSKVLARGYAWLTDAQGRAVTSAHGLSAGQSLQAVLADGQAQVRIEQVQLRPPFDPPGKG